SITFDVTLEDNIDPIIVTEAEDLTVESDGQGNLESYQEWLENNGGASAKDNCSDVSWSYLITATSDECGATGSTEVTFTATDASGNTSETKATFTIEDNTAPVLSEIAPIGPTGVNGDFTLTASYNDVNSVASATWYFNSNGEATRRSEERRVGKEYRVMWTAENQTV